MKQEFQVTCPYCAVGCRFKILKGLDEVVFSSRTQDVIEFDYQNPVNEGALCPRGHFSYELLSHPKRLGQAYLKSNGKLKAQIPEIIFRQVIQEMNKNKQEPSMAILINPLISLHEIRALLDFAVNNKVRTIDFIAPTDRHLFRAMIDNPFDFRKIHDVRELKKLNYMLCIGDIFTKQPVLSRHLLDAKYAFRQNALFHINPISSRTSWFANIYLEHQPHLEPLLLMHLYNKIYDQSKQKPVQEDFKWLREFITREAEAYFNLISEEQKASLDQIAGALTQSNQAALLFATHPYNASGSYMTGIICAAISQMTQNYFIPLYTDSNFSAIEQFSRDIYAELKIGRQSLLYGLTNKNFQYAFAAGWNPETHIPGPVAFPPDLKWIISSVVQDRFPDSTLALLPQAHIYEQMDLRTNFLAWQSSGSQAVKKPLGSSQPISQFIFQFHQKAAENKLSFQSPSLPTSAGNWQDNITGELQFYLSKIQELEKAEGFWLIPVEHVTQYKDANMTGLSSWAQKNFKADGLMISSDIAKSKHLKNGDSLDIAVDGNTLRLQVQVSEEIPPEKTSVSAHYSPARKGMSGEFAEHNKEYYIWCQKVKF